MNLPTKITLLRIALIPLMVILYAVSFPYNDVAAVVVFVLAAATDSIDGHIARSRNMVTDLGKFLDPIADKLLVVFALVMIAAKNILHEPYMSIMCAVIIARELIISGLRQIAATKGVVLAADKWGKLKTIVTCIAIPLVMLSSYHAVFYYAGYATFVLAFVLTIVSGINYLVKNKNVFQSEKQADKGENKDDGDGN